MAFNDSNSAIEADLIEVDEGLAEVDIVDGWETLVLNGGGKKGSLADRRTDDSDTSSYESVETSEDYEEGC